MELSQFSFSSDAENALPPDAHRVGCLPLLAGEGAHRLQLRLPTGQLHRHLPVRRRALSRPEDQLPQARDSTRADHSSRAETRSTRLGMPSLSFRHS